MNTEIFDGQGWLIGAESCHSPNFNQRPEGVGVNLLVIHNISLPPAIWGLTDVFALFQNRLELGKDPYYARLKDMKVSSHFVLDRQGKVYQCVSVFNRAWHAGVSSFDGIENCNDYSIGIELNGADQHEFTEVQYRALAKLSMMLQRQFPAISLERIVGHADIAIPFGRKTDPGPAFDWTYYYSLLGAQNA